MTARSKLAKLIPNTRGQWVDWENNIKQSEYDKKLMTLN